MFKYSTFRNVVMINDVMFKYSTMSLSVRGSNVLVKVRDHSENIRHSGGIFFFSEGGVRIWPFFGRDHPDLNQSSWERGGGGGQYFTKIQ